MMPTQHAVIYFSPGTFFCESSSRDVDKPDVKAAAVMAAEITERYNAKPWGFCFAEYLTHPDVPDGRGGMLSVERKEVRRSGIYHLGGRLRDLDEIEAAADPSERILRDNMRCNDFCIVVENTNSWKSVQPFRENDVLLDATGEVVTRGNDKAITEYRRKVIERVKAERGY